MIRFACACGRQLQARDEDIGKKAKCPSCGAISVVAPAENPAPTPPPEAFDEAPQPEERVTQDLPMSMIEEEPRAGKRRSRDRDEFDDEERPRKRRRRDVEAPSQSSGKAMASLICGIASPCLGLPAIPGLILGIWALRDIGKSDGELSGRGSAIAGIVLSCLAFILVLPAALLLPAVQKVREAAQRTQDANNLKQIGLAMHNFASTWNNQLPQAAAYKDPNGRPLLSWRVALLPYIEQDNLFRQFKLDEPWDSPNNKPLIALMPKTYAIPSDLKNTSSGMTYYQVFVGPGSLFEPRKEGQQPAGPQRPPSLGWNLSEITDGTSNTGMVFTAQSPVIWTKPDDLMFDPQGPLPPLGGQMSSRMNVGLADGSVRLLPNPLNEQLLRAIITRNGGETVAMP